MRTVIVGGGPGGLYLASLLKHGQPGNEVILLERDPADAAYGFGVVFSDNTLGALASEDPATADAITALGPSWDALHVNLEGRTVACHGIGFTSVSRAKMLSMLRQRAADAGVELHFGSVVSTPDDLPDHDLLVGADGLNSTVRGWHADAYGTRADTGRARYIWLATTRPFDGLTFSFVRTEHGAFGLHAYPFDDGAFTFLVEADPSTLRAAELDDPDVSATGADHSDQSSIEYLTEAFAPVLDGHPLLANGSSWRAFTTIRNRCWSTGSTVLIGDAAHTAHFSVGSGTRMAMEDALVLAHALHAHGGDRSDQIASALHAYEAARRPQVDRLQDAADPSLLWWERFDRTLEWPLERFALHFLTRTPRITRSSLRRLDPGFMAAVDTVLGEPILPDTAEPSADDPAPTRSRVPLDLEPDEDGVVDPLQALTVARELVSSGAEALVVRLADATSPRAAGRWNWRLISAAEQIRLDLGVETTLVLSEPDVDLAATLVQSGRADQVEAPGGRVLAAAGGVRGAPPVAHDPRGRRGDTAASTTSSRAGGSPR